MLRREAPKQPGEPPPCLAAVVKTLDAGSDLRLLYG
jgi:hypothetical protein